DIIKVIGLELAVGLLSDAFIVRMMLIPELTKPFVEHSWYIPKWLQQVLPKIDIEGHEIQDTDLTRKESTVDEDAFVNGEESSTLSVPENMDDRTIQLYNDLLGDAANHTSLFNSLLFNALMQYAKDNNQEIYQKYLADSG